MIIEQSEQIIREVSKAFTGKDEIIRKVLMTIYAGGHILLEDCPGVGKTTLAPGFFQSAGAGLSTSSVYAGHAALRYHRFQHVQPPDESI